MYATNLNYLLLFVQNLFSFDNRNKRLRKKEFKTFRRSVKRLARNKGCAKNFWKYCDKDEDGEMTKDEWNVCLGTNELKDCKYIKTKNIVD